MKVNNNDQQDEVTTSCRVWVVVRKDGEVFGFTDHDKRIEVEGVVCQASSGVLAGALQSTTGLAVDNGEFHGAINDDVIKPADIRIGRWDEAEVRIYSVNWLRPNEHEQIFRGYIGEIRVSDGKFSAELRSPVQVLNNIRGRVYERHCDAILGDNRCCVDLQTKFVIEETILEIIDMATITVSSSDDFADGYFSFGQVNIMLAEGRCLSTSIRLDRQVIGGRRLSLGSSIGGDIQVGADVSIYAGCNKEFSTCIKKFDNIINFRGFPTMPSEDWLTKHPSTG
ncbi:DUF2163 domain-containing protein [uncultured Jannaschia sp.]|uniref:DUF2163 domain-containing protein n=1 Tax=uncultured Jannaschia sp. TaxID=293347 RepID=UPI002639FD0D|nr:DUF2163 domain-containing protein [uncultured Jannaschia sp.]